MLKPREDCTQWTAVWELLGKAFKEVEDMLLTEDLPQVEADMIGIVERVEVAE
jgi:hypothetical protein